MLIGKSQISGIKARLVYNYWRMKACHVDLAGQHLEDVE